MAPPVLPGTRQITLDAGGRTLTALLREPARLPARATVVALHGAGMSAGYFDGQADDSLSLLALGERLGFTVLAVDRPGYGRGAAQWPDGQTLDEQARTLRAGLSDFRERHGTGTDVVVLAHSFGGKLALALAADQSTPDLIGLDISSCGNRYAVPADTIFRVGDRRRSMANWGPLRLYPPNTFTSSSGVVAPVPALEREAATSWHAVFPDLAARLRVPVRFTFAEHETWWRHDTESLADLRSHLTASPRVLIERQPAAGHNISLGWAARSYHLRALGFVEECLLRSVHRSTTRGDR